MSIFTAILTSATAVPVGCGRRAAAIVLTCGLAASALGVSAAPAQAQGLLENLFGRSHAPAYHERYHYEPRRGGRVHHRRAPSYPPGYRDDGFNPYASADYERRRAAAQRARESERRRAAQRQAQREAERERQRAAAAEPTPPEPYTPPKVGAGPLGRFLHDTSLRRGDVVVTRQGLMVFAGRDGARQHSERDFRPFSQSSRLTGSLASQLRAIETSNSIAQSAAIRIETAPVGSGDVGRQVAEASPRQ